MKKLILITLFFVSLNSFSQKFNGYKFVYVDPLNYDNDVQ